jgi:hypothetical protein
MVTQTIRGLGKTDIEQMTNFSLLILLILLMIPASADQGKNFKLRFFKDTRPNDFQELCQSLLAALKSKFPQSQFY